MDLWTQPARWLAGLLLVGVLSGCELYVSDEDDDRDGCGCVEIGPFFVGNYRGDRVTTRQSGSDVTTLSFTQDGVELRAVDNHGEVWRGAIFESDGAVVIELRGETTVGSDVSIVAELRVYRDGDADLAGVWIEPLYESPFSASGTAFVDGGGFEFYADF